MAGHTASTAQDHQVSQHSLTSCRCRLTRSHTHSSITESSRKWSTVVARMAPP